MKQASGLNRQEAAAGTLRPDAANVVPLTASWAGSAGQTESTFHQLSPYIGKTKSSMAASLVAEFTAPDDVVYDPFSGCGTIAFEAWRAGRSVIANDLSSYAVLLTRAKLFPYKSLEAALRDLDVAKASVAARRNVPDLRSVPQWVRQFFHSETLREVLVWSDVLRTKRLWFLLACLMGVLHHQRPGFLSFPSSHTVPYLRLKKFPRARFPELYEYRPVAERLRAKVVRAFRRVPGLDFRIGRRCYARSAEGLSPPRLVDAIITSPPYMRQLDYGRDNRLRLWFLDCPDWQTLDNSVSPGQEEFLQLMRRCFAKWRAALKPGGNCVLIVGDASPRSNRTNLPGIVARMAIDVGYEVCSRYSDAIPNERRVRRGITGSTSETTLVLRNAGKPERV